MMHSTLLILGVLLLLSVGGKSNGYLVTPKQTRELESDLRAQALFSCAKSTEYTSGNSSLVYVDGPVLKQTDDVLSKFVAVPGGSRVVYVEVTVEERARNSIMPVALTGAYSDVAPGKRNGKEEAENYMLQSRKLNFLPKHHVRQNATFCVDMGRLAERGLSSFYERLRSDFKQPYMTILNDVALHNDGTVALQCGLIQPSVGCCNRLFKSGRVWRRSLSSSIQTNSGMSEKEAWQSMATLRDALPHLPVYDEVFVISARWDYNFHHFLVESVLRLVRFYRYLQRNPHIKIHIREHEMQLFNASKPITVTKAREGKFMRQRVFDLLGISPDRIVEGQLLARKLYLPNDIECMSSLRNGPELQLLSKMLVEKAQGVVQSGACVPSTSQHQHTFISSCATTTLALDDTANQPPAAVELLEHGAKVIVQARACKSDWRCMNETAARYVARTTEEVFPRSEVVIANTSLSRGLGCDIDLYRNADVVIGVHGAAMTNVMFMRPGTILVEIVGEYDMRMTPVCGFHGPYAATFGVHHYIYYYDGLLGAELRVADLLHRAYDFYLSIRNHANYTIHNIAPISYG